MSIPRLLGGPFLFPKSDSSKRREGEEAEEEEEKKKRERREREDDTHMSCSHTFSHLILSYALLSHPTCGIATPISKYNLSSALRGLCTREGGCPLPSATMRVACALPACFTSRVALPHQLPS
jgi:hypothetical protein